MGKGDEVDRDEASNGMQRLFDKVRGLKPTTEEQKLVQSHASEMCYEIVQTRWTLIEQEQNSLPTPFIVVLLLWLTALNIIYGIFAPRNKTVIAVFAACAFSVSGAIFIIYEMSHPLDGMIKISSAPLRKALEYISN
jgi:membrane-bound ClpP family serine protease